ncbi:MULTISPECIES: Asp/Glu/hydantoin racemase [Paraburkholderia]|uniref:Asp/Glu/hydantoin racemase n=1 Tax=Paraburkholderia dipogonis TaxID=1211383 RepID=A0A4Y8MGL2_9BURK|nr:MULTISPECIES: Asp/Glu/hydantoin racemase [Paraburkholderia]RKR31515.1 maleate isomerase [Paraburkholderia sp. BL17N1]TFE36558.1 Asp/Glu/hydantoin racemase [Paraburkholderia dipogonis]
MTNQSESQARQWVSVPYELTTGIGSRAHIGMVVISNDQTLSHEARAMLSLPGVALYESRIPTARGSGQAVSKDTLRQQADKIGTAIKLINSMRPSDVIALGCTSAAMVIGQSELERLVREVHPSALVTDPFRGIKAALKALKSKKIGYVSPYPQDVASDMVHALEDIGMDVTSVCTFSNPTGFIGDEAPFISPESVADGIRKAVHTAEADTIVVACTQMRAAQVIDALERETGKRIISSNQALCWHALRLAECDDAVTGWGQLFHLGIGD